jgi:hypothetical protein
MNKFTNQLSFYYRKDLNVTKHGEYKAAVDMKQGMCAKRNDATLEIELATDGDDFEGIVDIIRYNVQEGDSLDIKEGERVRMGEGHEYEIVSKGLGYESLTAGANLTVENGLFKAAGVDDKVVAKVLHKFDNDEVVIRINMG